MNLTALLCSTMMGFVLLDRDAAPFQKDLTDENIFKGKAVRLCASDPG